MNTNLQPSADESTGPSRSRRSVIKGSLGVAAATVGLPALGGVASAHFPTQLDIGIQPANAETFIDLQRHETVPVAVYPTTFLDGDGERTTFDPTERAVRYRFGSRHALADGAGARPLEDGEVTEVDDGHGEQREALRLEFPVGEAGFDGHEETGWLYWERDDSGEHGYSGVGPLRLYGAEPTDSDILELFERLLFRT
ncbi:twin-arginine translocation signal domain-containing protein [Natronomonas marina]|jgi:hypothetical protein|uniref:twin-arginine translocation signal domain-containing protein n=1 Tax=Natronomonas marina TaxID=2961939 RepID=UPI0020C9A398|nr:twin-arginine translocation signal domain-containing protein [Natronomonas marina]